jgi:hypothetical protein
MQAFFNFLSNQNESVPSFRNLTVVKIEGDKVQGKRI